MWNEPDEGALLRRWFAHMREVQPAIYVTYNGDFFDWPFLETRAAARGLDMRAETGFRMSAPSAKTKECLSRWVPGIFPPSSLFSLQRSGVAYCRAVPASSVSAAIDPCRGLGVPVTALLFQHLLPANVGLQSKCHALHQVMQRNVQM